jgi:O-antigen/teichoic acid export membrane protein
VAIDAAKREVIARTVALSTASNYVGRFVGLGSWFLITPLILHALGPADYGLWVVVGSVIGFSSLLDLGIAGAVTRYVAQHVARREFDRAHTLIATALRIYTLLGLVAIAASVVVAAVIVRLLVTGGQNAHEATLLVVLVGLSVGITIPLSTARGVLFGLQRFDIVNLVDTSGTLVSVAATVGVLHFGLGLPGMVAINIPVSIVAFAANAWFINHTAPEIRFGWSGASRSLIMPLLRFSWPLFTIRVAGQLQTRTDEIVIASFLPISAVTPYALARKLSELARIAAQQFVKVLLPLASQLDAQGDRAALQSLYVTGTRVTLMIFVPVAAVLILLARPILVAWVGADYSDAGILVVILTLASLVDISQWPAGLILQGMGRHRPLALMSIGNGVANIALSVLLVQRLGVVGVALGTLVPMTVESLGFVLPYALRVIGVRPLDIVARILWPTLAPAVPAGLVLFVLREMSGAGSASTTVAVAGIGIATYFAAYFRFGASDAERRTYRSVVTGTVRQAEARFRGP